MRCQICNYSKRFAADELIKHQQSEDCKFEICNICGRKFWKPCYDRFHKYDNFIHKIYNPLTNIQELDKWLKENNLIIHGHYYQSDGKLNYRVSICKPIRHCGLRNIITTELHGKNKKECKKYLTQELVGLINKRFGF